MFKLICFEKSNIHGNNNIAIDINIIGLEGKHDSLFGPSPKGSQFVEKVAYFCEVINKKIFCWYSE